MPFQQAALATAITATLEPLRGNEEPILCPFGLSLAHQYLCLCAEAVRHLDTDTERTLQMQSLEAWVNLRAHRGACPDCNEA